MEPLAAAPGPAIGPALFRLDGRVAILAGGAGSLGGAVARGLVAAGAAVLVADRDRDGAGAVAGELARAGGDAAAVAVDVTDEGSVAAMVGRATERWRRIDILINAAGISGRGAAVGYDRARFDAIVAVNLTGLFLCCRAVAPAMLAAGGGAIVNFASIAGLVGYPGNPAYLASKGGVVQLTRALAIEWAAGGIRVNAIAPGVIDTPVVAAQVAGEPEFYAAFRARHPLGRFGRPDEVVGPVLFLCSDAASFVTGHTLAVDGGYVAQ